LQKLTLDQTLEALETAARLKEENRSAFFVPYAKQEAFCAAGLTKREILLMAGNQLGKSEIGSFQAANYMTGIYPRWWKGKKFTKPTKGWIAGESSLVVRDVQQKKLCGEPGVDAMFGTGMIPKDMFADKPSMSRGITDAYDTIQVKFIEPDGQWRGGISVARFKSYEQGRTKFQGETLDWGWCDEEPPEDIYSEFLTRLKGDGRMFVTFTPLKGRSKVVLRFMDEYSPDRQIITMTLAEVTHFTEEEKKKRVSAYLVHERSARELGIPILGSGGVYEFPEDLIKEEGIRLDNVPPHWAKLWGIDFGIDHPFAAVLMAWDKDTDVMHLIHAIRQTGTLPLQDAQAMRNVAANVPVAWPHDGTQREKSSGEQMATLYKKQGLQMLAEHATYETGGYGVEPAVMEIKERATTGRFKVASHLTDWFSEFRLYHRRDGLIVRQEDDLMSASEKIIMMKRFARPVALGNKVIKRRSNIVAEGVDKEILWGF
jgi:phage terminase large subunit-like protein